MYDDKDIKIAELEGLLATEKGKSMTAARAQQLAERELEKARIEIACEREELGQAIQNSFAQIQQAVAISSGIYGLGRWADALIEKAKTAEHILLRENALLRHCKNLIQAMESKDENTISKFAADLQEQIAIRAQSGEVIRRQVADGLLMACGKQVPALVDRIMAEPIDYQELPGVV